MFGCYYNPFLFMRRPMYGGLPQTGSYLAAARMEAAANASGAALYPYSWYSNYGGEVQVNAYDSSIPLETVMQLQRMQANPYYVPECPNYIDYASQQRAIEEAQARGKSKGLKNILQIKYKCTLKCINDLAQKISSLLSKEGLSDEDRREIEAVQVKIEALKQKMVQYAQTAANKPLEQAIADVEAMGGEWLELDNAYKQLAQTIASRTPAQEVQEEEEQPEEVEETEPPVQNPPAAAPQNPNVVQNPEEVADPDAIEDERFDEDGKFKLDNENLTLEDVKNAYNEYRTQLNEYLKTEGLSAADKQAIINKSKELVNAIKENKPAAEAAKLYNELIDLVKQSAENINTAANQANLDKISKALKEEIVPIAKKLLNEPEISEEDKKAIQDKYAEVAAAIKAKKPAEEVAAIYNELVELLNKVNEKLSTARIQDAAKICADLYTASNGVDWQSKNEQKIKDTVAKINKNNVLEVMRQWEEGDYNSKTGDECMIDTIKHEFNWSTGTAKKLINHILKCLQDAAKELNMLEAITPELATIRGEMECFWWDEEKMYNAFNAILAKLGVKKIPGEQVQK